MTFYEVFEKRPKILLMDNDPESRSILRRELQAAHFDAITAENGKEGLYLAATVQSDLILLNAMLSELDSFTVCELLKKDPATCAIPVIFMTTEDHVEDIVAGLGWGAVDYMVKPYSPKELQARIRKAIVLRYEQEKLHDEIRQIKNNMVAMVSDELRIPVTVIAGFAKLLQEKMTHLEPSVQTAYLREILQHAEDLNHRIGDLQRLLHSSPIPEKFHLLKRVLEEVPSVGAKREIHG